MNTHTDQHTLTQFVSVYVANHPHILVLSQREKPEDKQQLLSHHLSLTIITLALPPHQPLFPHLPYLLYLSALLSPLSLPSRVPLYLSSQCCIDLHELSPAISPHLLIPTLSLPTSQGWFRSRTDTQSFFQSAPIACSGTVFPLQSFINLFFCSAISENRMQLHLHESDLRARRHPHRPGLPNVGLAQSGGMLAQSSSGSLKIIRY